MSSCWTYKQRSQNRFRPPISLAAWTEDDEIVLISERSVQTVSADGSLRDVAIIPARFYVLDAGS